MQQSYLAECRWSAIQKKQMKRRIRATWTSRNETHLWCLDFSDFGSDRTGLITEIEVSEAVIEQHAENSLLVAVALHHATMQPELAAFFNRWATRAKNPIHKMAILYVRVGENLGSTGQGCDVAEEQQVF